LTMSYTVLGLPFSANFINVVLISVVYIILALAIGLLVSTLADTQVSAVLVSAVIFMLPVILLSGMIFPIDNMPRVLQWFSCIIPARWYIEAMRKLMVQDLALSYVLKDLAILAGMAVVVLAVAVRKFNNIR
ncbi:MAG: ABC transporter permease, partial [Muribaculaceae bacterium]|nr:ABC transporter permease [Muribaculaceae bacterium]